MRNLGWFLQAFIFSKNTKVLVVRSLVGGLMFSSPTVAHAYRYGGCRWVQKEVGRIETAILNVGGVELRDRQSYGGSYSRMAQMGERMVYELRSGLDAELGDELRSVPEYDGHSVEVAGPVQFNFGGSPGSNIVRAEVGLRRVGVSGRFVKRKRYIGIRVSVRCSISINLNNPQFVGQYDLSRNTFDLSQSQLNISHSQDCSSSFGWIPIIGNLIDGTITRKVGKKVDSIIQNSVSSILAASYQPANFAGIYEAIPDGKFIYQGYDYGRKVRESLVDLFQHNAIGLKASQRTGVSIDGSNPRAAITNELFDLSIPRQGVRFRIHETRQYETVWEGGGRCMEP